MAKDPRLTDPPKNVNDAIQDRVIRHTVFLERFKTTEVNRIKRVLNRDIIPDINAEIDRRLALIEQRGTDLGKGTLRRLQRLEKALDKITVGMTKSIRKELIPTLDELSRDEVNWMVGVIREELGFDIEMDIPDPRTVATVVKQTPFLGLTLDQWFVTLAASTKKNLTQAIQRSVIEGDTIAQATRRIRGTRALGFKDGVLEVSRRQAEAIVRTAINHTTNQARLELFKENEDIIKGLQWTATLDSRTSEICAGLDGKVFKIDKGPRPPAHVNCRSTMTPLIKSASSLGLKGIPEGTRASINGQVPANITYGKWLKGQPIAVQEMVLGKTKAALFRNGSLKIDKFTNTNLEPLTLDELRKTEKSAFKRAGIDV